MRSFKNIPVITLLTLVALFSGAAAQTAQDQAANQQSASNISEIVQLHSDFKSLQKQITSDEKSLAKEKSSKIKVEIKKRLTDNQTKLESKRKEAMLRVIDNHIDRLQKTAERAARMPNIDDQLKASLSSKITAMISELQADKTSVENAKTRNDIKKVAQDIRGSFQSYRQLVAEIVNAILGSRLQSAVSKAQSRVDQLQQQITELKSAGKDEAVAEGKLAAAQAALELIKKDLASQKVKEASADFKKVYDLLREVIKNMQL